MCRRRAIGNAHQRADQTKPKGKYTIQDVEKILEKMENAERSFSFFMQVFYVRKTENYAV